jgi:hypothetical protein
VNERHLSTTNSVTVVVRQLRAGAVYSKGEVTLQFDTVELQRYRIEFRADLTSGSWTPLPGSEQIEGSGGPISLDLPVGSGSRGFYRIVLLP